MSRHTLTVVDVLSPIDDDGLMLALTLSGVVVVVVVVPDHGENLEKPLLRKHDDVSDHPPPAEDEEMVEVDMFRGGRPTLGYSRTT